MKRPHPSKPSSREEDFRDYEERDLRDGWPYADGGERGQRGLENRDYGDPSANFDDDGDSGFEVDAADKDGAEPNLRDEVRPQSVRRIDSDDLEAIVTEKLEAFDDVDITSIDVHADGQTVTIEGTVETLATSRRIAAMILALPGVRHVHNNLQTIGVDSGLPSDG